MRERDVEKGFCESVRKAGGLALKFVSPGWSGAPDRIVLFSGGRIAFVELKAPGKKPRPLQLRRKRQLEVMGFPVFILDEKDQIQNLIQKIKSGGEADAEEE